MPSAVEVGEVDVRDSGRGGRRRRCSSRAGPRGRPVKVARPDDHPRVAPDRDRHVDGRLRARDRATRPPRPRARSGAPTPSTSAKSRRIDARRLRHGLDVGDPDGHAGVAQPAHVELAVLLLVGDDEVGPQVLDRQPGSGFFVPRTRCTARSAGCVHQSVAPTSRSGTGRRERLGQRGDQRHDPPRRVAASPRHTPSRHAQSTRPFEATRGRRPSRRPAPRAFRGNSGAQAVRRP